MSELEQVNPHAAGAFMESWAALEVDVHETAKDKGWWDAKRNDGEMIALMHSELSEALEGLRHGNPQSDHIPEFTAVEEELADVIIRIMDFANSKGLHVPEAVVRKMVFNKTREHKHGGKEF